MTPADRPDPFSSYRSGFEIRTYRRCKRVLMFHNKIPGENGPVLVKSTDFLYRQNSDTLLSMLVGVTQRGYKKAESAGNFWSEEIALPINEAGVKSQIYEIKSIPRLDFKYTEFRPKEQLYKPFEAKGGDMPPKRYFDKKRATELRKAGWGQVRIARKLGVGVGTVNKWVHNEFKESG